MSLDVVSLAAKVRLLRKIGRYSKPEIPTESVILGTICNEDFLLFATLTRARVSSDSEKRPF